MFKGFKLEKIGFGVELEDYYQIGLSQYNKDNYHIRNSLDSFFEDDKSLNATEIIDSWFPQIKSNIFISHSHKDEKLVIALSGWLYHNFGLKSFIDSCVWGYGNKLIEMLDNEYSWLDKTNRIYHYSKVLLSASHVHMMLSTALSSMIDKTECLIFFDTPNATKPFETADKTESPWIYSEIAFSEIVRRTNPKRIKRLISDSRTFSAFEGDTSLEKALKLKYDLNSKHLKEINHLTLNEWFNYRNLYKGEDALDKLYEITFPITQL